MDHAAVSAALGGLRLAPGIGVPSPPEHAASVAGVTLHFRGRQRIAQSLRPSLLRAGVKLVWLPNPKDYFQPLKLQDWDIAAVVRCPSWLGDSDGGVTRDLPATPLVRLPDATMASSRVLDVRFVAGFGVDLAHLRLKE
jgi:hypothetical protein